MTRRSALAWLAGLPASAAGLDAGDRRAFLAWFRWLAESTFYGLAPKGRVNDCSSLLRFAYTEALEPHTGEWARRMGFSWLPPLGEVHAAHAGPELFATAGAPRQFADAENLMRHNTRAVGRDVRRALPGDLLFYRQLVEHQPWHSMIYLGASSFDGGRGPYVVYHTGADPGEVRRPLLADLLRHQEPRWRPLEGNANFLGVHRWNAVSEEG